MDLLQAIQNIHHDFLDGIMCFLSTIINHGEFWIAVGVLLVIFPKTRKCGLILLLAMLLESLMAFASYYIVNEVHVWMRKKASKTID